MVPAPMPPEFTACPLDPLTRATIRHGSDKFGGHLYTPTYHALFAPWRERPLRLLEIGVGGYGNPRAGGLSLRAWAEYFPCAEITGLDIEHKTLDLPPRVRIYQGSQADTATLDRLCGERGPFDIVIDDGSHHPGHMVTSFLHLYPRMEADGIYAIEDTQTCFHAGRNGGGSIYTIAHQLSLAMHRLEGFADPGIGAAIYRLAEITQAIGFYRNIVAFRRGSNTYPSNHGLDIDHPEVRRVFDAITAEAERNPAPASALSRIDMLLWAGRTEEAAALALAAAARYPCDRALLHELLVHVTRAGQAAAIAEIRARLAASG